MKLIGRWLGVGLLGLLLAGCIEQEVKIRLNADGSGTLTVTRHLSEMESGMLMLGEEDAASFDALTVIQNSIQNAADQPFRKVQTAAYAFDNLGEALPELENLVPLMPRFAVSDDQLIVSVSHEMNPYHGFRSDDQTNAFYQLEIEFPVLPQSETGRVEGTRVVWQADAARLEAFRQSEIGTVFFECRIPAGSIELDLKPRLVRDEKAVYNTLQHRAAPKLISDLNITIPIVSQDHRWIREGANASLGLYMPVESGRLPFCYEDLSVDRLIIDGQSVVPELQSEPAGVFSGTDVHGREAPGIPVSLKFGWDVPALNNIDRIDVSMRAAVPTKTSQHTLAVDAAAVANAELSLPGGSGKRIAVLEVDHACWQSAKLKLATNLNPTDLSMVHLDTPYGLRYRATGMTWTRSKRIRAADRALGEKVFGTEVPFSIVEIFYPHIPTISFRLVFSRVDELAMKEFVLSEENIHVD